MGCLNGASDPGRRCAYLKDNLKRENISKFN